MAELQVIRQRWQQGKKLEGFANAITLADGSTLNGRYMLAESGTATPSHNPHEGFTMSAGFPTDKNGNSVNDRDYQRDQDAQQITRNIAAHYDARAIQSPVIVSTDGVVLSGNGRTMAGELAAHNGTDGAYIDYLKSYGASFGFSHEAVTVFAHPRLLFVLDDALPYTAATFARFNAKEMKGQSKTETAVKYGKLVTDEAFTRIVSVINAFETLGDFYAHLEAVTECLNDLRKCGVIDAMSYAEMFDGDTISSTGKETLENVLIGKAFVNSPDCARMITTYKSLRKSVVFALSEVANNMGLGEDYTLNKELSEAVNLAYIARQHGYKAGERVSEYARQMDAFSNETVSDFRNTSILVLADALNDNQVTLLKRIMAVYNHQAKDAADGQTDMFSTDGIKTKAEILEEVKMIFAKGSTKEQKQAETDAKEARLDANIFVSREMSARVIKGGYAEFICASGDTIVCHVDDVKRCIAYLSAKGGIKFWRSVSELKATADHSLTLPEWLQAGRVITDGSVSQRIEAVTDSFVIFEWINGGLFDVNISTVLQSFKPSVTGICEIIEAA